MSLTRWNPCLGHETESMTPHPCRLHKLNENPEKWDRHVNPAKYLPSGTASSTVSNLPVTQRRQPAEQNQPKPFSCTHHQHVTFEIIYTKMSHPTEQKTNQWGTICLHSRPEVWKWCIGCCCSTVQRKGSKNDISKQHADSHVAHIASRQYTPYKFKSEKNDGRSLIL